MGYDRFAARMGECPHCKRDIDGQEVKALAEYHGITVLETAEDKERVFHQYADKFTEPELNAIFKKALADKKAGTLKPDYCQLPHVSIH